MTLTSHRTQLRMKTGQLSDQSPRHMFVRLFIVLGIMALPVSAAERDKSEFTLTNPTPRELWRELSADRPDFTESPYTVDAGAVQLEMSFIDYAKNGGEKSYTAGAINLKLGLTNNTAIQFVWDSFVHVETEGMSDESGIGDTQIRLKINVWGNDGGDDALALIPFVKLPTADDAFSNDHVEGGLIIPYATSLSDEVGLGLMVEFDAVYDEAEDDYDLDFVHTAALGCDVNEKLGVYIEGIGIWPSDSTRDYQGILGVGTTYALRDDFLLDFGVNLGLTGDADDINIFSGITIRF